MPREGLKRKAHRANSYWHEDLQRKARCRCLAVHAQLVLMLLKGRI